MLTCESRDEPNWRCGISHVSLVSANCLVQSPGKSSDSYCAAIYRLGPCLKDGYLLGVDTSGSDCSAGCFCPWSWVSPFSYCIFCYCSWKMLSLSSYWNPSCVLRTSYSCNSCENIVLFDNFKRSVIKYFSLNLLYLKSVNCSKSFD